jgi:hypothetical protein
MLSFDFVLYCIPSLNIMFVYLLVAVLFVVYVLCIDVAYE